MTAKPAPANLWEALSWDDINLWAGSKIASRGRSYQRDGLVAGLAQLPGGGLLAWVDGTERYATRVEIDAAGRLQSVCTCPYEVNCKHGVATVLEYLDMRKHRRRVPLTSGKDERLALLEAATGEELEEEDDDDTDQAAAKREALHRFLQGQTKAQLVSMMEELALRHPDLARKLADCRPLREQDAKGAVARLRREIQAVSSEGGWRSHWNESGFTPDYSGIRRKLGRLLQAGHADAVLELGRDLLARGTCQVEESRDEGETAAEIASCVPVLVAALERSSLAPEARLVWAVDAVLADEFDLAADLVAYLQTAHPRSAWQALADELQTRLKKLKPVKGPDAYLRRYHRDRIGDWAIHALERAGREEEAIRLCMVEAGKTGSFARLVERLMAAGRLEEAERWIKMGIVATASDRPGAAAGLRDSFREIRVRQKNWPVVAALEVEDFVRQPGAETFDECRKAARKAGVWPPVREALLAHLETGKPPWRREGWPLPDPGLGPPAVDSRARFPLASPLVDIAILEQNPSQVLRWHACRLAARHGALREDDDAVAAAVQDHAPYRAVAIWQGLAQKRIAEVKPQAYEAAAHYLRKAAKVMQREGKAADWGVYLQNLRQQHLRKRRLMEILDGLDGSPLVAPNRR